MAKNLLGHPDSCFIIEHPKNFVSNLKKEEELFRSNVDFSR